MSGIKNCPLSSVIDRQTHTHTLTHSLTHSHFSILPSPMNYSSPIASGFKDSIGGTGVQVPVLHQDAFGCVDALRPAEDNKDDKQASEHTGATPQTPSESVVPCPQTVVAKLNAVRPSNSLPVVNAHLNSKTTASSRSTLQVGKRAVYTAPTFSWKRYFRQVVGVQEEDAVVPPVGVKSSGSWAVPRAPPGAPRKSKKNQKNDFRKKKFHNQPREGGGRGSMFPTDLDMIFRDALELKKKGHVRGRDRDRGCSRGRGRGRATSTSSNQNSSVVPASQDTLSLDTMPPPVVLRRRKQFNDDGLMP